MDVTTADSKFRYSTLQAHPLFSRNPEQYRLDQVWRADIPKAGVRLVVEVAA
jgi:hypothetical protein